LSIGTDFEVQGAIVARIADLDRFRETPLAAGNSLYVRPVFDRVVRLQRASEQVVQSMVAWIERHGLVEFTFDRVRLGRGAVLRGAAIEFDHGGVHASTAPDLCRARAVGCFRLLARYAELVAHHAGTGSRSVDCGRWGGVVAWRCGDIADSARG